MFVCPRIATYSCHLVCMSAGASSYLFTPLCLALCLCFPGLAAEGANSALLTPPTRSEYERMRLLQPLVRQS